MSNYVLLSDNKVAFHPGYYIEEYIQETGLTQEDFAKRLGTTPKNISLLIRGEQSISLDIASKLSRMIGTSIKYWLNLQNEYDVLISERKMQEELNKEIEILKLVDYNYFRDHFNLPDLPRKKEEQVKALRSFLNVSSLSVFENVDLYVRFRGNANETRASIIKSNMMVQIATNIALKKNDTPAFDKSKFEKVVDYVLELTEMNEGFCQEIYDRFYESGVNLILLPNLSGSRINGATKKVNKHIMLMINDRNHSSDTFWFTLLHEVGHILNGDYGISLQDENDNEDIINKYAEDKLIPANLYNDFIHHNDFTISSIKRFAKSINRDPGIIVGRLEKDEIIKYGNKNVEALKRKYSIDLII